MHFTSADSLSTIIDKPDTSVALIPMSGYVFLFPPTGDDEHAFGGLQAVFVGDNGKVLSRVSYDELYATYESTESGAYLDAANYLAALYLDCVKNSTAAGSDERTGCWYTFTEDQLTKILQK